MHAKTNMTNTCNEQSESNRNSYYDYTREGKFPHHGKLKKVIPVFVILLSCIFFIASIANATNYYVDKANGNDSNNGTQSAPWKTIGKANSTLAAGDTVLIRAGTYTEVIKPSNIGSSGNYITYQNYSSEVATFTGGGGVGSSGKSYIKIDGLKFEDITGSWMDLNNSDYWIIQNCTFINNSNFAGIYIHDDSDYNQILSNTFTAGANGPKEDSISVQKGSDYNLFQDNTFTRAGHSCIMIRGNGTASLYNIVKNNTMDNDWWTVFNVNEESNPILIEGNTFKNAGSNAANHPYPPEPEFFDASDYGNIQVQRVSGAIIRNNTYYNGGCFKVNIPALKGGAFKTTLIAVARISHVFCDTLYII